MARLITMVSVNHTYPHSGNELVDEINMNGLRKEIKTTKQSNLIRYSGLRLKSEHPLSVNVG